MRVPEVSRCLQRFSNISSGVCVSHSLAGFKGLGLLGVSEASHIGSRCVLRVAELLRLQIFDCPWCFQKDSKNSRGLHSFQEGFSGFQGVPEVFTDFQKVRGEF